MTTLWNDATLTRFSARIYARGTVFNISNFLFYTKGIKLIGVSCQALSMSSHGKVLVQLMEMGVLVPAESTMSGLG